MARCCMVEPWSAVPEWIAKAEGDWEALEILLTRNTPGLRVRWCSTPSNVRRNCSKPG